MENDHLKERVTDKLEQSGVVKTIADELCHSLLADKPAYLSPDDYFHLVATALLESLRSKLLASCEPDRLVGPLDRRRRFDYDRILEGLLLGLERDLVESNLHMIRALGGAIAERDTGTNDHNYRVTIYAVRLAEAIPLARDTVRSLIKGAFLHDIGKIGIPDAILVKPSGLTEREREIIKSHVERGANIVGVVSWLADAMDVIRYHHERWDGTGYIQGLRGVSIPITARVFAVGDVFDALTSSRPYKEPYHFAQAREMIQRGAGTQFDPDVVGVFTAIATDVYREAHEADPRQLEAIVGGFVKDHYGFDWDRTPLSASH